MAKCEGFGEAFRIIDLAIADSLQPDTIFYNEVLKTASQRVIYLNQLVVLLPIDTISPISEA